EPGVGDRSKGIKNLLTFQRLLNIFNSTSVEMLVGPGTVTGRMTIIDNTSGGYTMNPVSHRKPLIAAISLSTLWAVPLFPLLAQSQTLTIEEVVVTARHRSESLQDVPIAVTAFSGDELKLRGAADITEIAQATPSVTLEPSRATNSTLTAFIRGVGQ